MAKKKKGSKKNKAKADDSANAAVEYPIEGETDTVRSETDPGLPIEIEVVDNEADMRTADSNVGIDSAADPSNGSDVVTGQLAIDTQQDQQSERTDNYEEKEETSREGPVRMHDHNPAAQHPDMGGTAEVPGIDSISIHSKNKNRNADEGVVDKATSVGYIKSVTEATESVCVIKEQSCDADVQSQVDEKLPVYDMPNENGLEDTIDTNHPMSEKSTEKLHLNNDCASEYKESDTSLSFHERFIENDCQEWIVNKQETTAAEQVKTTLVPVKDEIAAETERTRALVTDSHEDHNESLDDVRTRRQSPVEMEEVDLVENEAFTSSANPAANQAFGFLVTALREKLGHDATNVSDATLRQYICWKADVRRASDRFRSHDKFLKDNFKVKTLLLSVNPKVCYLLRNGMVQAPEELIDKNGSAVMVIRAAKCDLSSPHNCSDTDAIRAIFFTIQQMLERKSLDALIGGIVIVLDLVGAVRKNISAKVIRKLGNAAGCFPIRIKAIYVVDMPWWFPSGSKKLFSPKLRERIHLLKDKAALSEYIDGDRLLEEDGGIYSFDLQAWISNTLAAEVGVKIES